MSKKLISISIIVGLLGLYYFFNYSQKQIDPISPKNQFYSKFSHAIQTAKLNASQIETRDFLGELQFSIDQSKIIISTQKDPYVQIASLQQLFKTAKIRNKTVVFVDLSSKHPYATLKHNQGN